MPAEAVNACAVYRCLLPPANGRAGAGGAGAAALRKHCDVEMIRKLAMISTGGDRWLCAASDVVAACVLLMSSDRVHTARRSCAGAVTGCLGARVVQREASLRRAGTSMHPREVTDKSAPPRALEIAAGI